MTDTTLPMTKARWTILATGVPVVLGLIALCTGLWVKFAIHHLADLSPLGYPVAFSAPTGPAGDNLTLSDGNLTFRTGHRRDIHVTGNLTGSLAPPAFSHSVTATGLSMDPSCRAPIGYCDISFTVTAPAGLPIDVNDTYGQLSTSKLRGDITLTSNSGNITASRLAGTVRLNDPYGEINVAGVSGTVKMTSNSGDITAAGLRADTQISDGFGTVSVTGMAAPDVRCTSNSGDVTIVFATVPKHVLVTDPYGSVTLELPDTRASYDVTKENQFGSTLVTVPQSPAAQNKITVDTNSGDITIVKQGQSLTSSSANAHPTPTFSPTFVP